MLVLVLTGLVVAVVGWVVMFVLVLTGLVVAVVGCIVLVVFGIVSSVLLMTVLFFCQFCKDTHFPRYFRHVFPCGRGGRWDGRWDGGGTQTPPQRIGPHPHTLASLSPQGHRPRIYALTLSHMTARLCPKRDIDLTSTH